MFVLTGAQVLKINFDATKDGQLMASGVSFLAQGIEYIVKARREVILSAGTVQSPQILELSGIGSEDVLSKHGINVLINNPGVGENLQDHALAALAYEVADPNLSLDSLRDPGLLKTALESFQTEMSGPFASGVQASAFLPIVEFVSERGKTELQTLLEDLPKGQESGGIKSQHSLLNQALLDPRESTSQLMLLPFQVHTESAHDQQALFNPSAAGAYITLTAHIARPYSRGHVHIRSADPLDQPCIDPCYLSHPLDREILARHFRYLQTIARTEPLASKLATNGRTIPDGIPVDLDLASAKEEIKKVLTTQYHPIGTCAMMPLEKGGVVDAKLTVHGTVNLRVVDASVFPMQLRGNIQSTVYAIAEYAADMIKAKWVRSGKDSEGDLH
jgi:choline dehydrogenase-like flavoprotein